MGRQHQGMDRPGFRQVPEGSGEQGKMEKTGCKIISGAPTTLAARGLMMMMMIMIALDASETWPVDSDMSPADVVGLVDKNDPWVVVKSSMVHQRPSWLRDNDDDDIT